MVAIEDALAGCEPGMSRYRESNPDLVTGRFSVVGFGVSKGVTLVLHLDRWRWLSTHRSKDFDAWCKREASARGYRQPRRLGPKASRGDPQSAYRGHSAGGTRSGTNRTLLAR